MATSDEQRAAWVRFALDRGIPVDGDDSHEGRAAFLWGWQEALRQQALQARANRALLQRCRYEIASLHDIYHDEMTYVPKALARLIQDIDAALAANPQQIMGESDVCAGGQEQSPRRAGASQVAHPNPQQINGAVEKPTKEPDAAIGASQVPEGVANAERSAMQLCPTPNPQQSNESGE